MDPFSASSSSSAGRPNNQFAEAFKFPKDSSSSSPSSAAAVTSSPPAVPLPATGQPPSLLSEKRKEPAYNNELERQQTQLHSPGTQQRPGSNAVIVNGNQRGNPILDMIRSVFWEFGDIMADYQLAPTTGMVFLSLKYHRLHPEYIYERTQSMANMYVLRLLMIMVDIDNHQDSIRELTKMAIVNKWTVVCAFSREEVVKYIESFKFFQYKPPDAIRPKFKKDYQSRLAHGLTRIRHITQSDVIPLMQRFKTLRKLVHAKEIDLQLVKGIGDVKANYLYRTLHVPFNRITKPRPIPVASKDKPASKPMHDFLEKFNSPSGSEISGPDKGKQVERRAVLDVLEATAGAAAAEAAVAQAETRAWEAWEDYDGGSPEWD